MAQFPGGKLTKDWLLQVKVIRFKKLKCIRPLLIYSDSDSDTEVATKSATDAIKSFDDLFSNDDKKNE